MPVVAFATSAKLFPAPSWAMRSFGGRPRYLAAVLSASRATDLSMSRPCAGWSDGAALGSGVTAGASAVAGAGAAVVWFS
ncbi:MAG: hypothetical protein E6I20_05455 [Chloroflexi bacterium]|nr:MAG: hypothetical protein E6I20_05455 [Chloroflexota bacterium]